MPRVASPFPIYLSERYRAWRALRYAENRAWYARLAEGGQHPRAMIVTCCDSRVEVANLFGAEPGDLFVVRNVANLVPPYEPDDQKHGASAALEYAVTALKVAHVVVLGHSDCGGVAACCALCEDPEHAPRTTFVGPWMSMLAPAHAAVAAKHPLRADRLAALERESVLVSLRNLETFPFVREAVDAGMLTLHGAWIDIAAGRLHVFAPETRVFLPVD
jgi:carbonic anhydrase